MKYLFFLFLCCYAAVSQAVTFAPDIENSRWELESSRFFCRLTQPIPTFGKAVFEHEAGEQVKFFLQATESLHFTQAVSLFAEAAPWQPGIASRFIANVVSETDPTRVEVAHQYASQMLAALTKGMRPTFTANNWYSSGESIRIAVSAVNFQPAYTDYMGCISGLLPVNYRQVARTAMLFPGGGWRLSDATRARLDEIMLYIRNDDSVHSIFVDGHSDNQGRRLANRDLSKQRAEAVTEYLVSNGIDPNMITTRYHGERYPVVPNNSKENRARNRRVTVRLERE